MSIFTNIITHTQTLWILSDIYCLQRQENHVCAEWAFKMKLALTLNMFSGLLVCFQSIQEGNDARHILYIIYIYIGIKIWLSPICHLFYLKHPFSSVPCAWFYHFVPRKFQTYTACWPQTTGVIYNMPSTSSSEGCGFYPWCYDCIQTNPPCYHRRNGETACETVRGKGGPFSMHRHHPTFFIEECFQSWNTTMFGDYRISSLREFLLIPATTCSYEVFQHIAEVAFL